jgi:hypothetical protein
MNCLDLYFVCLCFLFHALVVIGLLSYHVINKIIIVIVIIIISIIITEDICSSSIVSGDHSGRMV